jgi:DNA topoisomerase-2
MWRSASRRAAAGAISRRLGRPSATLNARISGAVVPGSFCGARGRSSWRIAADTRVLAPSVTSVPRMDALRRAFSTDVPPAESVESIYQKKTPLEHVLLRPGMYIGSVEPARETMWVPTLDVKDVAMQQQAVEFVPALYKIFDEIVVNAVDNKVRDPNMRHLDVVIEPKGKDGKPWISVHNDGRGIPVKFHRHEQVYVPELVLGHLLTGSNFDDASGRLTGGRHGYGAKLTNIFSSEFVVETGDAAAGLRYKQTWRNNMRERGDPEITMLDSHDPSSDFTRVSFSPDLKRFEMDKLTPGMLKVLTKRVVDVAGCLSDVEVTLNGKLVPINGFESYIQTFRDATTTQEEAEALEEAGQNGRADYIYARVNKRWQVGVLPSDIGFVQISFVNGMAARRGGTHINYIGDQLCRRIADHVNKKFPDLSGITGAHVKPHLALFINCKIENPTFDSQMKELLTSRPATFGSTCILSDRFSKVVIANSGIVERVVDAARAKQRAALLKKVSASASSSFSSRGRMSVNVPKLEDANLAGGPRSSECALILTEGDSAKALAVAGLAVVGRDKYGVFPLRGKVLNVRDATVAQLSKNAELAHLCTILGLNMDETYDTLEKRKQLRYGKVIVMTDQDHDGSHIKGLLFNLFHTFWPELLQSNDDGETFMSAFITPLVKVTSRTAATATAGSTGSKKTTTRSFYSLSEYLEWKRDVPSDEIKQCIIKYYKGLGTSTSAEGREYFRALDQHLVPFSWSGPADGDALDLAFSKARAADRKTWLLGRSDLGEDEVAFTGADGPVSYQDFVNKELIHFSHADNLRSLPSVVDGLKVSQRKVLFACLKRKLTKEVKVAQLAGYCSEHTAYHHGEMSLHATIVNMAQDYVGSNNLPLLYPSGQFGTRLQGGKDAASARYIFTSLQRHTRALFPEDDDALLDYVDDDGFPVEPRHYVPIIPMLLVNGSEGIGTGWSSSIPSHHPVEIIDNLLRLIDADAAGINVGEVALTPMAPWVKGFHGRIRQTGDQAFVSRGVVSVVNSSTLRVTELPVGRWVEDYKRFLWELVGKKTIRSFSEHHSERDVRFDISMARADLAKLLDQEDDGEEALIKLFKLETSLSTSNMHAFDAHGTLVRYETSGEVLRAFYNVRRELYAKRKSYLEKKQAREVLKLRNRIRFIDEVAHGELQMVLKERIPKAKLVKLLEAHGFSPASAFKEEEEVETVHPPESMEADAGDDAKASEPTGDFDYLLNTPLLSFTREVVDRLQREHDGKEDKLARLQQMTPAQVWRLELETLRASLVRDKDFRPPSDA